MLRVLVLVCVVGCLTGCSLTYKKRVIRADGGEKYELMEYGLIGLPVEPGDAPGGLLPLYRSEIPMERIEAQRAERMAKIAARSRK